MLRFQGEESGWKWSPIQAIAARPRHVGRFELRSVASGATGAVRSERPFDIQVDNPTLHINFPSKELTHNLSPWMTKLLPS